MGSFIDNCHVHTDSIEAVKNELARIIPVDALIIQSGANWVSVYTDETLNTLDVAQALSSKMSTGVIAINIHDSDVLSYWLYENGELCEDYCSRPDYFGEDEVDEEREPAGELADSTAGRELAKYAPAGTQIEAILEVLQTAQKAMFVEDELDRLADLLGIDADCAGSTMRYLMDDDSRKSRSEMTLVTPY